MAGVQFAKRVEYRKKAHCGTSLRCSVNHGPAGGVDGSNAERLCGNALSIAVDLCFLSVSGSTGGVTCLVMDTWLDYIYYKE